MPRFHLHVLGTPRVTTSAGADTVLPAGKPLALLSLIALEPPGITRDDAAAILWPASSHDRARASVRQALWALRKHLGDDLLVERADGLLGIDETVLATDVGELSDAMGRGDAEAVTLLWSGGPFRGFLVPDAPAWNQWASELHSLWEGRVGVFLEDHAAGKPADQRLEWIERALGVRPYRPALHALRIRTLLELGWLEEAQGAIAEARDQLGQDVATELEELEASVHAAVRDRYGGDAPDPLTLAFVGRGAEFATLSEILRTVRSGHGRVVGIIGAPGIGKTRLASEFSNVARASGVWVAEARSVPGERRVEYGVIAALARQLLALPGAAGISNASVEALQALVPSRGNGSNGSGAPPAAVALGDAFGDLLDAVAEEAPLLLVVDDVHWTDEASRTLLHRAMRLVRDRRVLLVETCRTEMGEESVLRFLRAEAGAGRLHLIPLAPLDEEDVTELLIQLAEFRAEEDAAEAGVALYRASRGHPLHLVALLRSLRTTGVLEERGGRWAFRLDLLPPSVEMPSELQELLASRLTDVSDDARVILQELSHGTGGYSLHRLRRMGSVPDDRFARAVGELFEADLIGWSGGERVDFSHELLRDAVRGRRRSAIWKRPLALGSLAIAAAAVLLAIFTRDGASPWEGTVMRAWVDGVLMQHEPGSGGGWVVLDSVSMDVADGSGFVPFYALPERGGEIVGQRRQPERGPDLVLRNSLGEVELLFDGGGDDGILDLSPDGASLLVTVEDTLAERYRRDLAVLDLRTGAVQSLVRPEFTADGAWNPDGRSLVAGVITLAGPDTLLLLRPDGSVIQKAALPEGRLGSVRPCGGARTLVSSQRAGQTRAWYEWDWDAGNLIPLPEPGLHALLVGCSPDGAYRTVLLDREAANLSIFEAETFREELRIPLPPGSMMSQDGVEWVFESVRVPAAVFATGPDSLAWGEVVGVQARVYDRRGRVFEGPVEWAALEPEVLGVRGDSIVGNWPGEARVVARIDGWLADTLTVRVSRTATEDQLLNEDFADFPTDDWAVLGEPPPRTVVFEGERVLKVGMDAVWSDGVRSRVPHAGEQGLTAEVEFRLPLTARLDRQSILICLIGTTIPVDTLGMGSNDGDGDQFCVRYPQGENQRFDSAAVSLLAPGASDWIWGFPVSGLGTGEWATLGIQVRPDGVFSAIVNGREVAVYPEPVDFDRNMEFNLEIVGRTEDTELLVRRATVWRGARY